MKNNTTLLWFIMLALITSLNSYAQKPCYPIYSAKENIPFGAKLPLENRINGTKWIKPEIKNTTSENSFQVPTVYFDTLRRKYAIKELSKSDPVIQSLSAKYILNSRNLNLKVKDIGYHITKDINAATRSSIPNNITVNGPGYALLNGVMYFAADDGIHSMELWRSDGTESGTYMVKDIEPGLDASNINGIVACNGLLYFSASTKDAGSEPWVSDGTEAGTHILKDLIPGPMGSDPTQFLAFNESVLFVASIYNSNNQLWKTDGTEQGTFYLFDNYQIGRDIFQLTKVNKEVFFVAFSWSYGYQLFKTNGEPFGINMVRQIGYNYDQSQAPQQLTAYNGKLYFSANEWGYGRMLWTSDGTWYGTTVAKGAYDIFMVQDYLDLKLNNPFIIMNDVLFISARTKMDGAGLYKYDASNDKGMVMVKDLTPLNWETDFIVPVDMRLVNDAIYMKVISSISGWHDELWISKGEEYNTHLVKNFNGNGIMYLPVSVGDQYFFAKYDDVSGSELWTSNGTEEGTVMVKDVTAGPNSSSPYFMTAFNDKIYFTAEDPDHGAELWASDGTSDGTKLVFDINAFSGDSKAGSAYKGISRQGGGVVFNAITNELGGELYYSDGTSEGTYLINDIAKGGDWSYPNSFVYKNGENIFIGDDKTGTALYKTSGTTGSLKRVTPYIDRNNYYVTNINLLDNGILIYMLGNKSTGQHELWRSDGTDAGTFAINKSLNWDTYTVVIGNLAYFVAGDYERGYELWKTDGSFLGTKIVRDINVGYNGSYPYSLFAFRKELYFGAWDGGMNSSLWKSDGSEKGTVKIKNISPARFDYNMNWDRQVFCISNGTLFFSATDYNYLGSELWKTNGTEGGTKLVMDINSHGYSNPNNLTDIKGILYFTADDGVHGNEIWYTNGNENSTKILKDIHLGTDFADYKNLTSVNGILFFVDNTEFPNSLWMSDGTEQNTKKVEDEGVQGLTDFMGLTAVDNKLFFGAISSLYGAELFVGEVSSAGLKLQINDMEDQLNFSQNTFRVFPNPARDMLNIEFLIKNPLKVDLTIHDISGRLYIKKTVEAFSGLNNTSIPISNLPSGMYFIKIHDQQIRLFKFIKE